MNRLRTIGPAVGLALLLAACASFEANSYKTLGTVANGVELARKGWVDYVTQQRALLAPDSQARKDLETQVAKSVVVYGHYQNAMAVAEQAVIAYKLSPTNQAPVTTAINALAAASGDIVKLVNGFMAKPTPTK